MPYEERTYRSLINRDNLTSYNVKIAESDLFISSDINLTDDALKSLIKHRNSLESYIKNHPEFRTSLLPLAKEFVLFNFWYSSLPGPTWPNRFFIHAATSGGLTDSPSTAQIVEGFGFKNDTIYQRLEKAGKTWCIYHDGLSSNSCSWAGAAAPFGRRSAAFRAGEVGLVAVSGCAHRRGPFVGEREWKEGEVSNNMWH